MPLQVDTPLSRPDLWARIHTAELPGEVLPKTWYRREQKISFQSRLYDEHKLTDESLGRLEAEYRRFLYLKVVDGGVLTPSKRVDQAWHLHLESPGNAWERFCDEVLGVRVEHWTGLTPDESRAGYERTLALYRREFGEDLPGDIWPGDKERRLAKLGSAFRPLGIVAIAVGFFIFEAPAGSRLWSMQGATEPAMLLGVCLMVVGGLLFLSGILISQRTDLTVESSCG